MKLTEQRVKRVGALIEQITPEQSLHALHYFLGCLQGKAGQSVSARDLINDLERGMERQREQSQNELRPD